MNLAKVIEYMGGKKRLATAIGRSPQLITSWLIRRKVPPLHIKKVASAVKARKRLTDRLYKQIIGE